MVKIVQLELRDFKTYVGSNVLPFRGKFIVISGPNGSGKSNFVDAIAFVMGAKLSELRVSQMTDLCHPSKLKSTRREKSNTFVKVILRSNDGDEQCFQRSIVRSQYKYSINDNEVTFHDYKGALKKLNINTRVNNFLVFQDSVESIITKKPFERTLLFEEICGSAEFKADYDRLKETLQTHVNENRILLNTKRSLTKEIKDMQLRKMESRKFQELFKQNQAARENLLLFDLHCIRRTLQSLISEEQELKSTIRKCDARKSIIEEQLAQMKKDFAKMSDHCGKRENVCSSKELVLKKLTGELVELKAKREYLDKRANLCKANYESAKIAEAARQSTIHDLEHELNQVQQMKDKYVQQYFNTTGRDIQLSESEIEQYANLKNAASVACSKNIDRLADLEREYKHLEDIRDYEKTKLAEAENAVQFGKMRKTVVTERILKLQKVVEEKETILNEKRTAYEQLTTAFPFSERELEQLRQDIEKINEEIGDIKEDEFDSTRKTQETVKELKEEFSGVYGHLGGLCRTIHNRYNVAVTKVLGANADAIVVDSAKTAWKCIKLLRDRKIGVYTFLPLDQLRECKLLPHLRTIENPPNVKLLYDVISFSPPEISKAVFYATGNTLVAETQEDASKVAYETAKGQNCVSLDGCYYTKSGLISGGNHDLVRKAKRWDSQRKRDLKDEKEKLTARLQKILKEAPKQSETSLLATTIKSMEKYSQYTRQDLDEAYKELNPVENELKSLEAKKASLEENVIEAQRNLDKAFEAMSDLRSENEAEVTRVFAKFCRQKNIENIHVYEDGKRLYDEKIKEFDQQIDRAKNQLFYEESKDTKRNIERWEAKLKEIENELAPIIRSENETKLLVDEATRELETLQLKHQKSMTHLNETKDKIALVRNELTEMSKKYISLTKNLNKLEETIGQERAKVHALLIEAKVNGLSVVENDSVPNSQTTDESNSNCTASSQSQTTDREATLKIAYSKLPENLRDLEEVRIEETRQSLETEINARQAEMDCLCGANMPKSQQYTSLLEKLRTTNEMLEANRAILNSTSAEFNLVKIERFNKFNCFFEYVSKQVDVIYKRLMRNPAAASYLLPENPEEPYLSGIQYSCIVPGKSFQVNDNLSGGEKTMAALPLLFSIRSVNDEEPPFVILDEIDAALDHSNTMKVVNYLKETDRSQKIIITHKNEMLVGADTLVGITSRSNGSEIESTIFSMDLSRYRRGTQP